MAHAAEMQAASPALLEIIIRPRRGWIAVNWKELYDFRELLYYLALRDVKIRYKQTVLGVAWAVIQPLFTMLIFTLVFGRFAKMPSEGLPYPVYVFAGLIPWTLFSGSLTAAAQSLVQQQSILTKIYFPRLFIPTATLGPFLIDMLVSFVLYGLILGWYGVVPRWQVVFLPLLVGLTVLTSLGLGFLLSAMIVVYRDVRHLIPFLIQILLFASPVIYPAQAGPDRLSLGAHQPTLRDHRCVPLVDPGHALEPGHPLSLGGRDLHPLRVRALLLQEDRTPLRRHGLNNLSRTGIGPEPPPSRTDNHEHRGDLRRRHRQVLSAQPPLEEGAVVAATR